MMYRYEKARQWAIEIGTLLQPHCEAINIAGSIRRQRPEVKDIELLCIPKKIKQGSIDLFGVDNRKTIVSPEFEKAVASIGKAKKGSASGRYMQIETTKGKGIMESVAKSVSV